MSIALKCCERGPGRADGAMARWVAVASALAAGVVLMAGTAATQNVELDTTSLGDGPYAEMHTLLEKTIFKVDVLTLDVRFGPEYAERIEDLVDGRSYRSSLADSVAAVAIHATNAWARIRFERNVSLGQFLGGIRDNMAHAREAGFLDPPDYEKIDGVVTDKFAFLGDRGIHDGDQLFYRIQGDTLRTIFQAADGRVLLDQTDVGPERRLAVLGSYQAPKSDFREGLIRSLFRRSS